MAQIITIESPEVSNRKLYKKAGSIAGLVRRLPDSVPSDIQVFRNPNSVQIYREPFLGLDGIGDGYVHFFYGDSRDQTLNPGFDYSSSLIVAQHMDLATLEQAKAYDFRSRVITSTDEDRSDSFATVYYMRKCSPSDREIVISKRAVFPEEFTDERPDKTRGIGLREVDSVMGRADYRLVGFVFLDLVGYLSSLQAHQRPEGHRRSLRLQTLS